MVNFQILFSELKEGHCREKGVSSWVIQNFRFADAPISIRFIEQTNIIGGGAGHKDHLDRDTQST
uniref:Uncharacterized protein n=1 Tax=Brassica campestris TaxID=3711 RepID=A0A3P5YM58_BRACM|nr:unnamed protein product [Brassica rapa]